MRKENPDWTLCPYRIDVSHDGHYWHIQIKTTAGRTNKQICSLPGWYTHFQIYECLRSLNTATSGACSNFTEVANLGLLEEIRNNSFKNTSATLLGQVLHAQEQSS